jgi:hypothetical protein
LDDLGAELIDLAHQAGLSSISLRFDLSAGLFASAIGLSFRFG